jgi:hypothetical protein
MKVGPTEALGKALSHEIAEGANVVEVRVTSQCADPPRGAP